jgi:ubiquinone/menaquinone biosynthesis C-methylase UbiE
MAEAEELRAALRLQPGMRLLDLGSGRGWPGLYLSAASGCEVVLVDVPTEGLRKGLGRAVKEGIAQSVCAVTASARRLPFRASSFDAIVHADVLC